MTAQLLTHEVMECECERCRHVWVAHIVRIDGKLMNLEPVACARCKTRYWNRPRIRGTK